MRQIFLVFILILAVLPALQAQIQESFSDEDFTQSPVWTGDIDFFNVNTAGQLQSKGPATTGSTIHLATTNTLATNTQWEFYTQLSFATSSQNYAEVHLVSDQSDLKGALRGYFVRIGDTQDEVSLYRKDGTTVTKIIDGADRTLPSSDTKLWVRVTRTATHDWTLELDLTGTRQKYEVQGQVQDARYTTSTYTGVLFKYSQANARRFYFDDFTIKSIGSLSLISSVAAGPRTVELTFSAPVSEKEATNIINYRVNGEQVPISAEWHAATPQKIRLQFNQDFETGRNHLEVVRIADAEGNAVQNLTGTFAYAPMASPGDVRITEIYADFNPPQDLPAAEFIEIYNRSTKTLNLAGWKYSDATASAGVFPEYLLRPGAYLIICAVKDTALYTPFGPVLGLAAFPSLNDSGDDVELFDPSGQLIDLVRYNNSWYREAAKKEGGWSLELIDVNSACVGASQWKASENALGGTPGKANSVQSIDKMVPVLEQVIAIDATKILLQFNEPLDSTEAMQLNRYSVSPGITVQQARLVASLTEVELTLMTPLRESERYVVNVQGVKDCSGNMTLTVQKTVVLPATPRKGDVVINEILFNPRTGGVDFVEVVNKSSNYLNLQDWKLANRSGGKVDNLRTISTQNLLLAPGEYLVLTSDPEILLREYPTGRADRFFRMASLPAFPDETGNMVLLLPNQEIMDEVAYHSKQHFKLISDAEGVSLERITLAGPSSPDNFHSAATTLKATPGYENSQSQEMLSLAKKLSLHPKTITPDGDGIDDALLLQFKMAQPGFVANVTIFDAHGRHIRKLSNNTLLGAESVLQWDGLTDAGAKAAMGYYVVLVELFNLQGQKEVLKETAVVGGRF